MGSRRNDTLRTLVLWSAVVFAASVPAGAQEIQLFDKFSFTAEASWVGLNTKIRLDSKTLGQGTTLSFEDDLNLDSRKTIPSLDFEWQIGRKHRLAARWQDIDRGSSAQALTEIQWGDEIIPVDAEITLGFNITEVAVDYTYYPWVRERWAAGFGLGLRVMNIAATLTWNEASIETGGEQDAKGTGPLPYLNFEYRRMLSENWRLDTQFGWLYLTVGDFDGGQWIAAVNVEYLLGRTWAFGGGFNISSIDVDWNGEELLGRVVLDIWDFSVFAKVRF